MAVQLTRRRFTVDEYYEMARAGILGEDDRVELIDGQIIAMPPIGPGHAGSVDAIHQTPSRLFGDRAHIRSQNPVRLGPYNEPEPDVTLLRRRPDSYRTAHPTPADVFLIIEVSDTTPATDRGIKMPMYARAGIAEAWVIDLQHDLVLVHREPTPGGTASSAPPAAASTCARGPSRTARSQSTTCSARLAALVGPGVGDRGLPLAPATQHPAPVRSG